MNNKLLFAIVIVVLFIGIFTLSVTVVNAKGLNLSCFKKQNMTVILKNDANIDVSKKKISEIPQVKIIKIKYRDKEWSKMVNKMDLPKMENPFKNEFTVKMKKNANAEEIYNTIKKMDFVEDVKYPSEMECSEK